MGKFFFQKILFGIYAAQMGAERHDSHFQKKNFFTYKKYLPKNLTQTFLGKPQLLNNEPIDWTNKHPLSLWQLISYQPKKV